MTKEEEKTLYNFVKEWQAIEHVLKLPKFDYDLDIALSLVKKGYLYDDFSPTNKGLKALKAIKKMRPKK